MHALIEEGLVTLILEWDRVMVYSKIIVTERKL